MRKNKNQTEKLPRIRTLSYVITMLLGTFPLTTHAREYFNPALLEVDNPHQGKTDLSVFEVGDSQAAGTYRVDIYLNNEPQGTDDVKFRLLKGTDDKESLQPCLSVAQLKEMGVKTHLFPTLGNEETTCADLNAIPYGSAEFRFSAQQLLISIPQAAIAQDFRGYVPESQWESGIPALLLNYSLDGATMQARVENSPSQSSQFANLRPGLNIGPWRLRNYTSWHRDHDGKDEWNTIYTYIQRDIVALKSQFTIGDSTASGDVFDGVPFRGAQLRSDEDMVPDSRRGYAPVVRGIARTNAQVTVRQNGYVIYQSYVTPGAFEINDMYPTGGSGDLRVTITEADGSEQQLVIPFASLPVLQRENSLKYALSGGQYRSYDNSVEKNPFIQGTAVYGLPWGVTAYSGGQFAQHYRAFALGIGKNLGDFGAFSVDVTQAKSTLQGEPSEQGQSLRVRYSKNIVETGTNVAIAGYRYSTAGFYGLQEVMDTYRDQNESVSAGRNGRSRSRTEFTLAQSLWAGAGAVSLSVVNEDYWQHNRNLRSIGAGYNNSWNGISYSLNYNYSVNSSGNSFAANDSGEKNHLFALSVSMPLERLSGNTYASYGMNTLQQGGATHSVGISSSALPENNLSWGVQQGYDSKQRSNSGNLNADYKGRFGNINAGYSYDPQSRRLNYGVQGGIVLHSGGVTFGQPLGETVALISAPGAAGVAVNNYSGIKTDWRGYAIVPYSTPYRKNQVQLNTETLPDNVELAVTTQSLVPTRGAVVRANFETQIGQRVMMTLFRMNGAPVPFGATVSNETQKNAQGFIVGDGGQVYLTGLTERGVLAVQWGNRQDQRCRVTYSLAKQKTNETGVQQINAQCR